VLLALWLKKEFMFYVSVAGVDVLCRRAAPIIGRLSANWPIIDIGHLTIGIGRLLACR